MLSGGNFVIITDDKNFYTAADRIRTFEQTGLRLLRLLAMSTDPDLTHETVFFTINKMLLK